jgi:mono/diheme cytochrome c family protein
MRTLRIRRLTIVICIVTVFASSVVCGAYADSISQKRATPTSTAAKENPIAPREASIAAGRKIYLKHCATCHGKNGEEDGPGVADLGIQPFRLCDPRLRA